jgi:hypothetical protein
MEWKKVFNGVSPVNRFTFLGKIIMIFEIENRIGNSRPLNVYDRDDRNSIGSVNGGGGKIEVSDNFHGVFLSVRIDWLLF